MSILFIGKYQQAFFFDIASGRGSSRHFCQKMAFFGQVYFTQNTKPKLLFLSASSNHSNSSYSYLTSRYRMRMTSLLTARRRRMLVVSSTKLTRLNFIVTMFFLRLTFLAVSVNPDTLSSWYFINLWIYLTLKMFLFCLYRPVDASIAS